MHDDVRGFRERRRSVGRNEYAPRSVSGPDDRAQILPGLLRVRIDRRHDFDRGLLSHQADDGRTNGTNTVLDDTNFLFHNDFP